jgi:very-short-patch-repair endonuclease
LAARQHAVVSRRQLLELVREAGLPLPVVNARIAGYEVDFHWPAARLIVETDGRETHLAPGDAWAGVGGRAPAAAAGIDPLGSMRP